MTHKLMTVATTILIAAAFSGVVATVDAQQREQFATLFVKSAERYELGRVHRSGHVRRRCDDHRQHHRRRRHYCRRRRDHWRGDPGCRPEPGAADNDHRHQWRHYHANGAFVPPAAGAVTATIAAPTAGDLLILVNTDANAITIEDTTGQTMASNIALGAGDSITLIGVDTAWVELSRSNNQHEQQIGDCHLRGSHV